jgi:hypothetical protein
MGEKLKPTICEKAADDGGRSRRRPLSAFYASMVTPRQKAMRSSICFARGFVSG